MKRVILLLIFAFLIAGGTVGILYQEGIGGMGGDAYELDVEEDDSDAWDTGDEEDADDSDAWDTGDEDIDEDETFTEEDFTEDEEATEEEETDADEDVDAENEDEADEPDAADEEAAAPEADAEAEALQKEKEAKAPFYEITVTGNIDRLMLHKTAADANDSMGSVAVGTKGYLIEEADGYRRLCFLDNKIAYVSKQYTELTLISPDEYPDALVRATAADAGTEVTVD